jgi:tetratricopeptide (TPR) repeat protein
MSHKRRHAWLLFAALLFVLIQVYGVAQERKPTPQHSRAQETTPADASAPEVDQAETAMQKGDFPEALTLLQKAVAAAPDDYRAWFDLGYVYNAQKQTAEAIEAYRKSVAARPEVFESNLNLGILLARQGNNAEAATYLKQATQLKPTAHPEEGLARAWQSLGHVLQVSDPPQAITAYGQAAKLNPKDPEPHLAAAVLLEKQNNLEAAAREYQTAADLDPKSQEAVAGLANIYSKEKKYPEAEAALRRVLQSDSQNNRARAQLGRVLAAEGKNDEAAEELRRSMQAGGNPQAELELGSIYVNAGNYVEAEKLLREAVTSSDGSLRALEQRTSAPNELAPLREQSADAHYSLGSLLMHVKKYPEAQQELLIAIRLKPDNGQAYSNLAVVAAENKQYQLAIRALDARAKYLPEIPATYFLRATSFDYLKAVPQAVEYYQRFLAAADGKLPDQEWQARHRLVALDPSHRDKYLGKK